MTSKFGLHAIIQSNIWIRPDFLSLVLHSARHVSPTQFFATGSLRHPANTRYLALTSRTIFPFLRMLFIPKVQMLSSSKLRSQTPSLPWQTERKRERERRAWQEIYIQNRSCTVCVCMSPIHLLPQASDCHEIWYGGHRNDSYQVFVLINLLQLLIPLWMQY